MKKILFVILVITVVTVGVPFFVVKNFEEPKENTNSKDAEKIEDETISVYIANEDRVEDMNLNQYLKEVVAAEMPAEFHTEALRAQAIAARTYLINRVRAYQNSQIPEQHKGAYICTDPTHCKAWIGEQKRRELWGEDKADEYWQKISDAVESTGNLIATYDGEPISAVFHSTSSGFTENAKDVWGGNVQYLVSVKSEGDELSPKYNSERIMSIEEFKKIAEQNIEGVNWDNYIIGKIQRSSAGGIISLDVGGIAVKGSDFRFMYGLRSTNIEIEVTDTQVKMSVKGYGHGVGMSQYGANYLANQGKNYEEILKTYYSGIEISECKSING